MTDPLAIGLDVGTSSARAFVFDRAGRSLGGAKLSYEWRTTADGGAEIDADHVVETAAAALDAALVLRDLVPDRIVAVGVASMWHTLVGVGADGRAVTPLYSWSDMRGRGAAAALRTRLDAGALHARTGAALHPGYLPARLRWLHEADPGRFGRARYWMSACEYLGLRLFGERRISLSMASGTGLFDQHTLDWDAVALDAATVDAEQLSPLVDLDEPYRALRPEYAARWPALARVPWLPAAGDGACANVGSGCVDDSRIALSLGTSGALRVLFAAEKVAIPSGLWCYRLDRRHPLLGGAVSNGGNVYEWLRETLRLPPSDELDALLAARDPGAHRLVMLPFFAGERSPAWPLDATATISGLTLDTTPVDIAQAALEAVTYRLALIHRLLRRCFPEAREIVASGGALGNSPAWTQLLADVLGQAVSVAREEEASSRGAALLALEVAGAIDGLAAAPAALAGSVEPDPARHEYHRRALERHLEFDARMATPGAGT